jgi:hypothetical protein
MVHPLRSVNQGAVVGNSQAASPATFVARWRVFGKLASVIAARRSPAPASPAGAEAPRALSGVSAGLMLVL